MNKKKILIIGTIITLILVAATMIYIEKKPTEQSNIYIEGMLLPESKEILRDSQINGLKISNKSFLTRNNISSFKATVTNETNENITINKLYVTFYNPKEEIKTIALYDVIIPSKETNNINIILDKDLSKISKIEYILE